MTDKRQPHRRASGPVRQRRSRPRRDKARELALSVLREVHENDAYANVALVRALRDLPEDRALSDIDRRFATELVYGVAKAVGTLDWIMAHYVKRPLEKLDPVVREILRLGLYQLFYLDAVPPSAACNTSVELAKHHAHAGVAGFVNGVLRSAVREPERAAFPTGAEHAVERLALEKQHPLWLVQRWVEQLGYEETSALCDKDNEPAPLCLRTNTLRTSRTELLTVLQEAGCEAEASQWAPEGILLHQHGSLDSLAPLQQGLAQVQDESSMLVAHVVDPQPGERVLDCCSAPGGKTTHMAALMQNQGEITALDIYDHKLQRVTDNAARLGIDIIKTVRLDAREAGDRYAGQMDRVLVDAPCSGLGVLRRRPDARWHKSAVEIEALPSLQSAILDSAAQAVRPGGVLVYSTCTIEPQENSAVVEAFLARHPEFTLEPVGGCLPESRREEKMLQLSPQRDGTDGFFIARMRRKV